MVDIKKPAGIKWLKKDPVHFDEMDFSSFCQVFNPDELCAKLEQPMTASFNESVENFIFTFINDYLNTKEEIIVSKEELVEAIKWYRATKDTAQKYSMAFDKYSGLGILGVEMFSSDVHKAGFKQVLDNHIKYLEEGVNKR